MFKIYQRKKILGWRLWYNFLKPILNISLSFPTQISSLKSCSLITPAFKEVYLEYLNALDLEMVMEDLKLFMKDKSTSLCNQALSLVSRDSQIPNCFSQPRLETESQSNPFPATKKKKKRETSNTTGFSLHDQARYSFQKPDSARLLLVLCHRG